MARGTYGQNGANAVLPVAGDYVIGHVTATIRFMEAQAASVRVSRLRAVTNMHVQVSRWSFFVCVFISEPDKDSIWW